MANKMTNVTAINFVLENYALPDEVAEKFKNMRASFEKKASYVSEADKAKAELNKKLAELILTNLEVGKKYTATEVGALLTSLVGENISNQRATHILNDMAGKVGKTVEKRISYFYLMVEE